MTRFDAVELHVDIGGETVLAGRAQFNRRRGELSSTMFQYEPDYFAHALAYEVDPRFELYSGSQQAPGLPGAFSDCAPDRWGRNLVLKRERALALQEKRAQRSLDDVDYLVGVSDATRQGALRFRRDEQSPFLDPDHDVPKMFRLAELMRASEAAARDDGDQGLAAVKLLLDAGTGSLGGARPKAAVRGDDGELLIAKFSHPEDAWDVMAWEATALDLAKAAGVAVPTYRLAPLDGRNVLLLNRFDRTSGGERIGYMSAMTVLERVDGAGGDYIEIAEAIEEKGGRVKDDLAELFRRAVVSVGLHNTDDHLRNHGFVHDESGWALSPAFDINPEPDPKARQTAIAGASTLGDESDGLEELARACRLSAPAAREERERIAGVLDGWRDAAQANGVRGSEIVRFAHAFESGITTLRS
ncbi:type II toxin-antitoxin system HipA family toxin [Microbacterium sp. NPDC087665]|uniref:type II toxin-antitoxin system HipA family toxin n=1 Tax=Microbacterium sp. NPDC087665 TaxID=3364194 RepID=UPI003828B268